MTLEIVKTKYPTTIGNASKKCNSKIKVAILKLCTGFIELFTGPDPQHSPFSDIVDTIYSVQDSLLGQRIFSQPALFPVIAVGGIEKRLEQRQALLPHDAGYN